MNRHVLITGGHGLIGSEIPLGYALAPTSRELNLLDYRQLREFVADNEISEVIHLAATVGGVHANDHNSFEFFSNNLSINANVMRVCGEFWLHSATFVLSTCVFPTQVQYPLTEDSLHLGEPHHTNFGYAYAKRMLEVGARCLRKDRNMQVRCVIPCNVFGKNDNYDYINGHVIPSLIHKCYLAKVGRTPFAVWGSGEALREFVYAPDIARALTTIHSDNRESVPTEMIVSPSQEYRIKDIVWMIAEAMEFDGEIVFQTDMPEGIYRKPTDNSRFRAAYPDFNFTDIKTAIKETCDHVRSNYDSIRK
jgi:GDP-L-fucose synthase